MKIAVLQFGGSNCDHDVHYVLTEVIGVDADLVWYKDELEGYDGVVVPGGFSYGDYLRAGAIAARAPIMNSVRKMADKGLPVVGICNGFQILVESGLLPGALMTNSYPKFRCEWVNLRVENNTSPFTNSFKKGDVIRIPIAHMEGNYFADERTLSELDSQNRVAFRYVDEKGNTTNEANPNGSIENIAGIINEQGNVLGMMPHPERASEQILGSEDGKKIFDSMVSYISSI
ncbi:MAG: phosphoribosylformylglycinamidine synthase I [Methanosarcinales archaeon]|nr:phosphoribosylformylglycinamidine synthase I [Methanosarcinales archaeon]